MAREYLDPAFIRINYVTRYAPHVMTVPSVALDMAVDGTWNFVLRGLELPTAIGPAVAAYINTMKSLYPPTTEFIDYVGFQQADPTSLPVPVTSGSLNIVGTGSGSWDDTSMKASQITFSFRTEGFKIFRGVWLDRYITDVNKQGYSSLAGVEKAYVDYVIADASWVSGRDGQQPANLISKTTTLNEKLRRAYRMT